MPKTSFHPRRFSALLDSQGSLVIDGEMLSVSTSQVPKLLGSLEKTYMQIHMYSVSSQIRDGIGRSLFICSWESHRSSTCHLPSHGLPWPFGGVVPPLLSTSNCFQVL